MKKARLFITLLCTVIIGMVASLITAAFGVGLNKRETVAYADAAGFSDTIYWAVDDSTMTLFISSEQIDGYYDCGSFEGQRDFEDSLSGSWHAWYGAGVKGFQEVTFLKPVAPKYINSWFYDFENVTKINGMGNLDTSKTVGATYAFYYCLSLTSLDLSSFDASKLTAVDEMFTALNSLGEIKISSSLAAKFASGGIVLPNVGEYTLWLNSSNEIFNSSAQLSAAGTYKAAYTPVLWWGMNGSYTTLYVDATSSSVRTEVVYATDVYTEGYVIPWQGYNPGFTNIVLGNIKPASMRQWFDKTYALTNITWGNIDTTYTTDMSYMLSSCNLSSITFPENFNTSNVKNMEVMFGWSNYITLDLSTFDTSKVENMTGMFSRCTELTEIDMSSFAFNGQPLVDGMFDELPVLSKINISADLAELFEIGEMSSFVYANANMFWLNSEGKIISSPQGMKTAGEYTRPYTPIIWWYVNPNGDKLYISANKDGGDYDSFLCSDKVVPWYGYRGGITQVIFNSEVVPAYTNSWFENFTALTSIDLTNLDTSYTTDMNHMFYNCCSLAELDLTELKTDNVTNMENMFRYCSLLRKFDFSSFNVGACLNFDGFIDNLYAVEEITVSESLGKKFERGDVSFEFVSDYTYWTYEDEEGETQTISTSDDMSEPTTYRSGYTARIFWRYVEGNNCRLVLSNTDFTSSEKSASYDYGEIHGTDFFSYYKSSGTNPYNNVKYSWRTNVPWWYYREYVNTIEIKSRIAPSATSFWFFQCYSLTNVIGIENLDCAYTTDMTSMFDACGSLTSLDLSGFDVSHNRIFDGMLYGLGSLSEIKISESLAKKMESTYFDVVSVDFPWYYGTYEPENIITAAYQMDRAGTYINPVTPIIYWGYSTYNRDNVLTISTTEMSIYTGDSGAFAGTSAAVPWSGYAGEIKKVVISGNVKPTYTCGWFQGFTSVTSIDLTSLVTTNVIDMSYMFDSCTILTELTLPETFVTSSVVNMEAMFASCYALEALDVSNFDTSKVTNMYAMFLDCMALTSLDISNFDTSNVTNMEYLFHGCSSLESLNLITLNFDSCQAYTYMLWGLDSLTSITISQRISEFFVDGTINSFGNPNENAFWLSPTKQKINGYWEMSEVGIYTNPYTPKIYWSYNAGKLTLSPTGTGNNYVSGLYNDTPWSERKNNITAVEFTGTIKPAYTSWWFSGFRTLNSVIGFNFLDTTYTTHMEGMFYDCPALVNLDTTTLKTGNALYLNNMFDGCVKLAAINVSGFDTANVWDMEYMFQSCESVKSLDLSNFEVSYCGNFYRMFYDMPAMSEITISSSVSAKLVSSQIIFDNPTGVSFWISPTGKRVDWYGAMTEAGTYTCPYTPIIYWKYDPSGGANVLTISNNAISDKKFSGTSAEVPWANYYGNIKSVVVEGTVSPASTANWFVESTILSSVDLSGLDTTYTTDMSYMFYYCSSIRSLDLSRCEVFNCAAFTEMFVGTDALEEISISLSLSDALIEGTIDSFGHPNEDAIWFSPSGRRVTSHEDMRESGKYVSSYTPIIYWDYSNRTLRLSDSTISKNIMYGSASYGPGHPWSGSIDSIETVIVEGNVRAVYTDHWFEGCERLSSVDLSGLNTENTVSMYAMFNGCSSLETLDLSNMQTGNVRNMEYMFYDCSSLASLDLSTFDMSACRAYTQMLTKLKSLGDITISKSVAENMRRVSFDVLGANTPWYYYDDGPSVLIYDARQMTRAGKYVNPVSAAIYWQYNSNTLTISNTPFTGNYCGKIAVTDQFGENELPWFGYYSSIRSVVIRGTVAPTYTNWWFSSLTEVKSIDLTGLDTTYTTDMTGMFYNCQKLADLKLGNTFDVSNVVSMDWTFSNCIALKSLDLSTFETPQLLSMNWTFCMDIDNGLVSELTELDLSNFNVSRCDGFRDTFYGLSSIKRLNINLSLAVKLSAEAVAFDYPNTSAYWLSPSGKKITYFNQMKEAGEYVCPYSSRIYWKAESGKLTISDLPITTGQSYSFNPLNYADETNVYWHDRITVTNITSVMFVGNVAPATARDWFNGFTSLASIDLSCLDTSYTTDMANMFYDCSSLETLDMSGLNVAGCVDFTNIFYNIPALKVIILSDTLANRFRDNTIVFSNVNESSPWYTHEGVKVTASAQMRIGTMYINPYTPVIYWQYGSGTLTLSDKPLVGSNSGSFAMTCRMDEEDPWVDYRDASYDTSPITTVTIQNEIKPSNTRFWFYGFSNLTTINGLEKLTMSYVTDMMYMFAECHSLKTLDLRVLSTSNVNDMSYAFYNCNKLESLDLSSFEMANCKSAAATEGMLSALSSLNEISISASLAGKMAYVDFTPIQSAAWYYEDGTKIIEASKMRKAGLYTSSYTPVIYWNYNTNSNHLTISAKEQSHTSSDEYGSFLATEYIHDWQFDYIYRDGGWKWRDYAVIDNPWIIYADTMKSASFVGNVAPVNISGWFWRDTYGFPALTSVDLSGLNTSNVTDMRDLFNGCTALKSLDLSNFDVSSTMYYSFPYTSGNYSYTCTYNGMGDVFYGLTSLSSITISESLAAKFKSGYAVLDNVTAGTPWYHENGTKVNDSSKMRWAGKYGSSYTPVIYWSKNYGTLTISDSPISYGSDKGSFSGADCFTYDYNVPWAGYVGDFTAVNIVGEVKPLYMRHWFNAFGNLKTIDLSNVDTMFTQDMAALFAECTKLQTITFGKNFTTASVVDMDCMFLDCCALKELDLRGFNTEKVMNTNHMFYCCCSLEALDLSNFTISNDTYVHNMLLFGVAKLKNINISLSIANRITETCFDQASEATPWRRDGGKQITDVSQMTSAGKYYYDGIVVFKNGDEVLAMVTIEKGKPVVYTGATPTKNDTVDTAYVDFVGWTRTDGGSVFVDLSAITQSTTVYASFSSIRLIAPEDGIIYDGNSHAASFENKTSAPDGDYVVDYSYSETANGSFEAEDSAKRAGWHRAEIVFGSHSISVTYQIAKKEVKITGGVVAENKVYDSTTSATANCTNAVISGLAADDKVNVASVNAVFADPNANDNIAVSLSGWVLGGADAGNYYVASSGNTSSSANITKRDVTVEITAEDSIVGHVKAASAQVFGCDGMTAPVVTLTYSNDKGYNSTKLPEVPAQYTVTATIVNNNFNLVGNNTAQFELISPYNMITGVHFEQEEYFYGDIVRKPQVTATHGTGTEQITYYKDINRTQAVNITEDTPPAAGTYYVYIKVPANYDYGEATTTVVLVIKPKKITVNIDAGGGVYGGVITYPTATVVSDSGTVPTVSFTYTDAKGNKLAEPPVNAGTYTAEVNLSDNNYEVDGTRSVQFVIEGASISDAMVNEIGNQIYTGSAITPALSVTLGDKTLIANTDYTVTYTNNINVAYGDGNAVVAGAEILISGIGNYTDTIELSFTITPVTITADMITVSDQIYTGMQITPVFTARYLGKSLVGNTDYTAVYGENVNVLYVNNSVSEGGSITITGKGNFVGTVTKQFKIKPADISTATIGGISDKDYTGEAIVPDFDVTLGTVKVRKDVDYILSVSANINVGTATATLTGTGNFTGSKKVTFNVVACEVTIEIAAKGGTVNNVVPATAKVYDKQNNELSVEVKFTYTDKDGKTSEIVPNVVGTYTVTASIPNQNYKVTGDRTAEFVISSATNSITELTLEDWIFGNPNEPEVVAASGDEAPIYFTYYLASDTLMDNPLSGKPENVGSYVVKAEIFSTANYGYAQATTGFSILPAQLTADMLTIEAQTYTGAQITPEVIISYLGNEYGADYYEVVGYGDNINVADGGSVTITASGNFEGSCTVNFEITAAEITSDMFTVEDCAYTGEQLTPDITFIFNETELGLAGMAVVYGENINVADGGTVTITASGNFTGEVTVEFAITPLSIYAVVTMHGAAAGSVKAATAEAFDVHDNKIEGVEFAFVYIDADGNESEEIPQTVGSYTVKAVPASANYSLTEEASATFVVSAEANTVTVELEDWIYGTPAQPQITVNLGDASKAVITYYEFDDVEKANPLDGQPVNVGKYRITVYIPATSQYSEAEDSAVFEIKPKEITVSGIIALDKQFDGTAVAELDYSEVTFSGLVGDDTLTLTATGTFDGANHGEHSVTVSEITLSGDAAANYTVAQYSEQLTATIERRQVKVNITPNGGAADSEIVGATAQVVDLEGNVIDTEVTFTYTDKDGNQVDGIPQARGTYTVTVEIPDDNYELTGENSTTFIVSASSNKITSFELEDWVYGSPNEPTLTAQHGDDTVVYTYYSVDEEGNLTELGTEQPKNAGYYKVVAFVPSTDDYASATAEVFFTISKKAISLDGVTAEGKVYDGTTDATLGFDGVTFDGLVYDDELTVTATGTFDGTDAGSHTVTVTEITLSGDAAANYTLTTTELIIENVQISAKEVSVEISVTNGVVGSVAFVIEVKILNDGEEIETEYSLVYYVGENELEEIPESAGEYVVEVVLPEGNYVIGGDCTASFIISANANSVTVELESWTYGSPNSPAISAEFGEDTKVVKYYKVNEDGEIVSELEGQPEDVGNYLITVSVEATTEYAGAEASAQFEIIAKEVKAVITVVDGLYGETDAAASAKVVDLLGNEIELEVTLTFTDADGNTYEEVPQAVGEYVVTATITDGNYYLTENTAKLTISATGNSITRFVQDDWTYGTPAEPVVEAIYGAETAQFTYYEVGGNGFKTELEGIPQSAGNYEIVVKIPATAEYAAATASARFSVLPKDVTVEITVSGGAANGNAGSVYATVIGYVGEVAPEVTFTFEDSDGNSYDEMPRIAGTYTVIAAIADGNYTLTGNYTAEFIVSENANSVTVALEGWTYGEPNTPDISADYGLDTAVVTYYKLGEDGEIVSELDGRPENVGNYLIKVYIATTVVYEAAEASVEFTISPKQVLVDIEAVSDYLGEVQPATAQITDLEGNPVNVEFTLTYVAEDGTVYEDLPEVAGKYTVTVTISDENYKIIGKNTQPLTISMLGGLKANDFVLVVEDWTYGSPVEPKIEQIDEETPIYGAETVVYTYYMADDHELLNPLEGMPENAGSYVVVATIAVNMLEEYDGATQTATFTILAKEVSAVIEIPESIQVPNGSDALEESVPAKVTIEGLAEIDWQFVTIMYVSTDGKGYESEEAPVEIGKYKVVVTLSSENYLLDELSATVAFTVAKKAEDENGNGSIELPDDREFDFLITGADTDTKYDLKGMSVGRKAQLWEIIDGTRSTTEFTGSLKATITFKVPDKIFNLICKNGIDLEVVKERLSLYKVEEDGTYVSIDFTPFVGKATSGSAGELMVKVEYDGTFPAEFVFNDASYKAPKNGLPWWAWMLIAIAIVLVVAAIALVVVVIVLKKRKVATSTVYITQEDEATKRKLAEHEQKIEELMNRDDGGFGTVVDPDDYDA